MTDFDDIFLHRFLGERGALDDETPAADYKRLLDGRVPNISYSDLDSLAGVSIRPFE